jgi:hypothetical protein
MIRKIALLCLTALLFSSSVFNMSQEKVYPGADEKSFSRAQYFSWINNTNEGATESHTLINLEFFQWLRDEFGMQIDIYAFDAGAIDGKRFYGRMESDRFREQFPNGFEPIYKKARAMGTRLGVWGGPDGFGQTREQENARIEQMVGLCRDYDWALFKFDAVCGPLRPEKEDAFIRMMTECRKYSPDLILLNHRLGLDRAQAHATTFLWEGKETYIDVFSTNRKTAPHHRADALARGLVPDLLRLTEDHGVCLSSCLDYWEDDLVLQAFNRCLILAPQLYGNPWLLRDDEYPRLARIFNLHRKYRDILVNGQPLPKERFGPFAVTRGDAVTRLITLRNLTWEPVTYTFPLDTAVGLAATGQVHCRQFFPNEHILGTFAYGSEIQVEVAPFRACLILVTSESCDEPGVSGTEYQVIQDLKDRPLKILLRGSPGTSARILLPPDLPAFKKALLGGKPADELLRGESLTVDFPGEKLRQAYHRKLAELQPCNVPDDVQSLYEATVFAADNNALEVRSLERSGPTQVLQVKNARDAFFSQAVFRDRGIWDQNLFDGDPATGFWPSRKYRVDQRVKGGCLRLDLGEVTDIDTLVLHVPDEYSLQPLLNGEGNFVEVSQDLKNWEQLTYLAGTKIVIEFARPVRYLRFPSHPDRICEIEAFKGNRSLPRTKWRASNLFAHPRRMEPVKAWQANVSLDQYVKNSYLCIALEGEHVEEGAYAALKVNGRWVGCPDRAPSFPSNTWEYVNARRDKNYTYYVPVDLSMIHASIEVYVVAYEKDKSDIQPVVWVSAYPAPLESWLLELVR